MFVELCAIESPDDGLTFLPDSVQVDAIREDQAYGGMRVKLMSLRWANRLAEPQQQQRCALEDEPVGELGLRKAIQQAFTAEARKRELVLHAELAAPFNESCLYGGDDVLGSVALHMTTASR